MGGDSQQPMGGQAPRDGHRQAVGTKMNPCPSKSERHIDPIVHEETRSRLADQDVQLLCQGE